jgi:hypothetical protein
MSSVFTQSPNRGFEESRCRARNMAGATPPPPEPDPPWCKTVMSGMRSYGYKPYKSWEQHSDSDSDIAPETWPTDKWLWLAAGGGQATGCPSMEPYSSSLLLRAYWESTVTGPDGSFTLRHNVTINRYDGSYLTDQWLWRVGEGFWQSWDPDGGVTPYDWLYIKMINDPGLVFLDPGKQRERSVTVGGSSASGTETWYWASSEKYPDGTSTTWTATYVMYNSEDEYWSESMVGAFALNMLNSVSWDSVSENSMTVMSVNSSGSWVRTDGYPLPFTVGTQFPAGEFMLLAEGGQDSFGSTGPSDWGTWGYRKSRVAWPGEVENILNPYALKVEWRSFAIPCTDAWPGPESGPDNRVDPGLYAPDYQVFYASAGQIMNYYYRNAIVHIGSAWAIPSESSATPSSTGQGPLSTQ